ncbi:MAG: hypothetical protein IT308_05440 [Anaerolineaceae bacterium]|nr:hypothetical protein [Anaerolineaceae bacterium]
MQKVLEAVEELNLQLEDENQIAATPDTILFGKGGRIDSLGLVNLIVILEGLIADEFDQQISLADERAISQTHSPFRTVQSLADYILILLKEGENA